MPRTNAEVAQNRRVRQVALPAADGKLHSEVLHHSVGDAKVTLAVLKVNGIDFVGHGGGSNLAGNGALPDVIIKGGGDGDGSFRFMVFLIPTCEDIHCTFRPVSLEVAKGDIAPHVPVKVNEDIVEADGGPKKLSDIVVRLDLGDIRVELQRTGKG